MQPEDTSVEDDEPLVKAERDKQLHHVESERSAVKAATDTFRVEPSNLRREAMSRLNNLGAEFDASPDHARETLTALTAGERFRFEPHNGIYRVVGLVAAPSLLMAGTAPDRFASPGRFDTVRNALAAMSRLGFAA